MEVPEKAVETFYVLEELNYMHLVQPALKAALDLGIPDILAAAGPGASLTPHQIAASLPRKSHDTAVKVARILRLLAHKGVFAASEGGASYGLTDVSRHFVTGSEFELTPLMTLMPMRAINAPLEHLRETVEDDGANGFLLANGSDLWSYGSENPDFNEVFNAAMRSRSKLLNSIFARYYGGFRDVQCLVDIGGGVGGALGSIMAAHPHIRGKNFDLPHVVSTAPQIPGVEHVAGNFIEFVPSGDAMLLQVCGSSKIMRSLNVSLFHAHLSRVISHACAFRQHIIRYYD